MIYFIYIKCKINIYFIFKIFKQLIYNLYNFDYFYLIIYFLYFKIKLNSDFLLILNKFKI